MYCITYVHWYFVFFRSQNACNIIFFVKRKKKKGGGWKLLSRKSEQKDFCLRVHLLAELKRKKKGMSIKRTIWETVTEAIEQRTIVLSLLSFIHAWICHSCLRIIYFIYQRFSSLQKPVQNVPCRKAIF